MLYLQLCVGNVEANEERAEKAISTIGITRQLTLGQAISAG
jgi:hypothetical protein